MSKYERSQTVTSSVSTVHVGKKNKNVINNGEKVLREEMKAPPLGSSSDKCSDKCLTCTSSETF